MSEKPYSNLFSLDQQDFLQQVTTGRHFGALLLSREAKKSGGDTTWLDRHVGVVSIGSRRCILDGYFVSESALGLRICSDKSLTKQFLRAAGIETPISHEVEGQKEAIRAWEAIQGPIVIKPARGRKGNGVSVNLDSVTDIIDAFKRANKISSRVLIEEYIEVESELRIMASQSESLVINKRVPASVTGDGSSTIGRLIKAKNRSRRLNPSLIGRRIPIDDATASYLRRRGMSLEDVPDVRETVFVGDTGGLSRGGDIHQYYEEADERIRAVGPATIGAIPGLTWGGIDVVLDRKSSKPYVIEVNVGAGGFGAALFPSLGPRRDVTAQVWKIRQTSIGSEKPKAAFQLSKSNESARLGSVSPGSFQKPGRAARLSRLIVDMLVMHGEDVREVGPGLIAIKRNSRELLFTDDLMSQFDRCVATRSARRHERVRALLAMSSVPHVAGRSVETGAEVQDFFTTSEADVVLTPAHAQWGNGRARLNVRSSLAESGRFDRRYVVQERPLGWRARILAGRERPFAVVSEHKSSQFELGDLNRACSIAVDAVRAIPELRWAVVEVVISRSTSASDCEANAFVEGLTLNPKVEGKDYFLFNDLGGFASLIAGAHEAK